MYEADANDLDMHDIHNGDSVQSEHVTEVPNQPEDRQNQISVANCISICLLQIPHETCNCSYVSTNFHFLCFRICH